jgi:1-phosphofructokinase
MLFAKLNELENGSILVLSGSLPKGCPDDFYSQIMEELAPKKLRVIVDTSGPALNFILNNNVTKPFMIKPNLHELETFVGRDLQQTTEIIKAAQKLNASGIENIIVSMGSAGSLFVCSKGVLHASPPTIQADSSVGAGDAMVAGLVAALIEGLDLEATAKLATAFAVGKLGLHGPNLPSKETINSLANSVSVHHVKSN